MLISQTGPGSVQSSMCGMPPITSERNFSLALRKTNRKCVFTVKHTHLTWMSKEQMPGRLKSRKGIIYIQSFAEKGLLLFFSGGATPENWPLRCYQHVNGNNYSS